MQPTHGKDWASAKVRSGRVGLTTVPASRGREGLGGQPSPNGDLGVIGNWGSLDAVGESAIRALLARGGGLPLQNSMKHEPSRPPSSLFRLDDSGDPALVALTKSTFSCYASQDTENGNVASRFGNHNLYCELRNSTPSRLQAARSQGRLSRPMLIIIFENALEHDKRQMKWPDAELEFEVATPLQFEWSDRSHVDLPARG